VFPDRFTVLGLLAELFVGGSSATAIIMRNGLVCRKDAWEHRFKIDKIKGQNENVRNCRNRLTPCCTIS
jgi:hypothetical protein